MENKTNSVSQNSVLLKGHKSQVLCLDVNEKSGLLLSGSEDQTSRLWDLKSGKSIRCFLGFSDDINSVIFSKQDNPEEVYISSGKKIFIFDLRRPEILLKAYKSILEYNEDEIDQILFNSNGSLLASCDDSGAIKILQKSNNKNMNHDQDTSFQVYRTLKRHQNICSCIAFHPRDPILLSGGLDSSIILWDYQNIKPRYIFDMNQRIGINEKSPQIVNPPFVHSVDISETKLVAGLGNSHIVVFDLSSKKQTHLLQNHSSAISHVQFPQFERNNYVISGSNDTGFSSVSLWSIKSLTEEKTANTKKKTSIEFIRIEKPELQIPHQGKVNWLVTTSSIFLNSNVYVASEKNDISAFQIL